MLVRGIYYEGWDPSRVPVQMHREQFLERVRREFPYEVQGGIEPLVHSALLALGHHVSEGEWEDIRASVPGDLAPVLP